MHDYLLKVLNGLGRLRCHVVLQQEHLEMDK